jgi:hypothetical protein
MITNRRDACVALTSRGVVLVLLLFFFLKVIRYSVLGVGTYEDMLTRVIVSRAEIDMKRIKEEYRARYKSAVTLDVAGDTSFGYRDMLLALVGSEE